MYTAMEGLDDLPDREDDLPETPDDTEPPIQLPDELILDEELEAQLQELNTPAPKRPRPASTTRSSSLGSQRSRGPRQAGENDQLVLMLNSFVEQQAESQRDKQKLLREQLQIQKEQGLSKAKEIQELRQDVDKKLDSIESTIDSRINLMEGKIMSGIAKLLENSLLSRQPGGSSIDR